MWFHFCTKQHCWLQTHSRRWIIGRFTSCSWKPEWVIIPWGRQSCFYINWSEASSCKCVSTSSCSILFLVITQTFFPFTPGLSDSQVCPWHQPSECSDGWHEGSGGGGGQGRQHRHGPPQSPGENRNVICIPPVLSKTEYFLSACHNSCVIMHNNVCHNSVVSPVLPQGDLEMSNLSGKGYDPGKWTDKIQWHYLYYLTCRMWCFWSLTNTCDWKSACHVNFSSDCDHYFNVPDF